MTHKYFVHSVGGKTIFFVLHRRCFEPDIYNLGSAVFELEHIIVAYNKTNIIYYILPYLFIVLKIIRNNSLYRLKNNK